MRRLAGRGGSLGAALLALVALLGCGQSSQPPPRNVLLITIDTLRADYLHAYGFEAENSPHIDALAAGGVLFENAIAAASLTAPAHASIMTSRYVREHSIGTLNGETRLEGGTTLAERFRAEGYRTAAFISNVVLRRRTGLDRGFDLYDDDLVVSEQNREAYFERIAADTAQRALQWLEAQAGDDARPVFVWLHLQDPHGPYTPPDSHLGRVGDVALRMKRPLPPLAANFGKAGIPDYQKLGELRDPAVYAGRYAEEILYADEWVGRFVAAFEAHSAQRGAVVLLTSDHGESMGEGGWFFQHGQATTPDLTRVPFIVRAPGLEPGRSKVLVSHVDAAPTLLELAGVAPLETASGISLAPMLRGASPPGERVVFSDTDGEAAAYVGESYTRAGGALASARGEGRMPMQFETVARNPAGHWRPAEPDHALEDALMRYIEASTPLVLAGAMEAEHIEQLRALGYLPPSEPDPGQRTTPSPEAGDEIE
jgi:arylsulfatase A-like enzyme